MKFLIVRLGSLGDVIHSLPIVFKLRQEYPDAKVDWLTSNKCLELLSLVKEINNVYLPTLEDLPIIQKEKYDYVIDVQGLFKSAFLAKLSFGQKIIGFKNTREFADIFYDEKINVGNLFKTKKHIVDLNLELVSGIIKNHKHEIKFLIPQIETRNSKLENPNTLTQPSIVAFPATTWESKMWPMNYWYELLSSLSKSFQIYLCGSKGDLKFISELINKLDSSNISYKNLIGKTNVKDLIYLIQNVNLVIGMDSFGLHLASAIKNDYGLPLVIGIYGPTSLSRNGPYKLANSCLYLSELECIACRKKKCPLGHHNCMNNIIPSYVSEMVFSELNAKNMLNSYSW